MTDKSLISGRQRIQGDLNLSGMLLRGKMRQCGYVKVEKAYAEALRIQGHAVWQN